MTNTTMGSLREVQKLDERIREIEKEMEGFDERLAEVEEPALAFEAELAKVKARLAQMEADARRLERAADDKRSRAERMDQRLGRVANLREEAAVRTELDLIRKAIEGDEQEALQLMDQIRRTEMAGDELEAEAEAAREAVKPRQEELREQRSTFEKRYEEFQARRREILEHVGDREKKVYDAFHQSDRTVVVAPLLEDGACGHCFGVIPLQLQNEIRQADTMIRCEACGVILTTEPEPILEGDLEMPSTSADELPDDEQDGEAEEGPETEEE